MTNTDEVSKSLKLFAGGVIPALANLVFNGFTKLISDTVHGQPFALDPTTLDISVGCAFAIVGVWVSCRDQAIARLLSLSVLLLVFLILGIGLYEILTRQLSLVLVLATMRFLSLCC